MRKNTRGITLIALIIAIIVLLILAGISISMITGEEGILQKVNQAKEDDEKARVTEELRLKIAEAITVLVGERKEEPTIASVSKYLQDKYKNTNIEMTIIYEFEGTADITITDSSNSALVPRSAIIQFEGWEFKLKDDLKLDENHIIKIGKSEKPEVPETPEEVILPENSIVLLDLDKVQKIKVVASNKDGVSKIKIANGEDFTKEFTYTDGLQTEEEEIEIITEFGKEEDITLAINGAEPLTFKITNLRYIRDAKDLSNFRDIVNKGNTFLNKKVELLATIDLSTVCSKTIGSWEPIGTDTVWFSGTFEGNYYTISNLYTSFSDHQYLGLFAVIGRWAVMQNVNMSNVYVYSSYNAANNYTGGIAGANNGIIQNCSINGGSISNNHSKIGTSNEVLVSTVGGITGANNMGTIRNSYNSASILARSNTTSSYANARAGGIAGHSCADIIKNRPATIINCYNKGTVEAKGYTFSSGGLVGTNFKDATLENSYNYGSVTGTGNGTKYIGGIVGRNAAGYTGEITTGVIKNSYCTTGTTYSYYYYSGGYKTSTANRVAADKLKEYTSTLGDAFEDDKNIINSGYPVLKWENELKQNSNTQ